LVQNVGQAVANVEITYSDGRVAPVDIQPGSSKLYYQGNDGTPKQFNGSAVVRLKNGDQPVSTINPSSTINPA
jgi:hypothetical protein